LIFFIAHNLINVTLIKLCFHSFALNNCKKFTKIVLTSKFKNGKVKSKLSRTAVCGQFRLTSVL
jgi:hypothetical protein